MGERIKVNYGGEERDAISINVNSSNEPWNNYLLEDGSLLKVKVVLTKVARVEGEYDKEGNPVYTFQFSNVSSVEVPKELKEKK